MSGRPEDGVRLIRHPDPFESERAEAVDAVQRRTRYQVRLFALGISQHVAPSQEYFQ